MDMIKNPGSNLFSYIIPHRGEVGSERVKNLKCIIELIKKLQQKHNIEIIIVEQDTEKRIELDPSINHILAYNAGDFSRAWGFNVGAKIAKGNILIFGDGDVFLEQNQFSKFLSKFDSTYKGYDIVSPYNDRVIFLEEKESDLFREKFIVSTDGIKHATGRSPVMGGLCAMWKKSYIKTSGWDEHFRGWGGEDCAYRDHLSKQSFKFFSDTFKGYHLNHERDKQKVTSYRKRHDQNRDYYFNVYRSKPLDFIEKNRVKNNDIGNPDKYK
jgi:predicted glycosyltransferase involved in capsule biosynthesis